MSSEQLADGVNPLDAELAATWDVLKGYSGRDTDLGIARRFGGASAAYSLRDIGAMNGRVVKVRRDVDGDGTDKEEDFSANQVQDGTLENWVNGKLESTLPADVATAAAAYSLRKVKADYSGDAVRIRRSSDDVEVDVAFDSDNKVSASSAITNVAEQGGESGQTTATTLGDFISGTDAFVHTWYDQAGSNDAVQETAANQPKIAENGALLADGVSFDGDFFLQKTTTDTTTTASIFGVHTKGTATGSGARPIGYQESLTTNTNSLAFAMDNSIRFDGDAATTSTQTIPTSGLFLATTIKVSNTEANNFINSVSNIADNALTLNDTDVRFTLGFASTTPDYSYDGSIQEAIFYNSDQSDNRFKIESNINNYYGLYNDANDLTQTEWQATGAESFSSTSTDGFSFANSSGTAFIGVTLSETLTLNDSVFVSFNASGVDIPDESPQIRLRDSVSGGDASSSLIGVVNNGFNSFELEYDLSQFSSGDNIVFSEGNTGGGTVTISDFKVSRIARNGFVQTWYDQSGNGNDATQGTAANQPAIVQNGGLNTDGLDFDGSNDLLDITNSLPITGANARSVFAVVNKDVSSSSDNILGIGDNGSGVNSQLWNLATTYGLYYNGGNTVFGAGSLNTEQLITAIYPSTATDSGDTVFFIDGSASSITSNVDTTLATDNTVARIGSGGGSAGGLLDGSLKEIIVFDSDKLSDRTDIEQDIKNFYNI